MLTLFPMPGLDFTFDFGGLSLLHVFSYPCPCFPSILGTFVLSSSSPKFMTVSNRANASPLNHRCGSRKRSTKSKVPASSKNGANDQLSSDPINLVRPSLLCFLLLCERITPATRAFPFISLCCPQNSSSSIIVIISYRHKAAAGTRQEPFSRRRMLRGASFMRFARFVSPPFSDAGRKGLACLVRRSEPQHPLAKASDAKLK